MYRSPQGWHDNTIFPKEPSMDSYIVRIYRQDHEQNVLAGIVEVVGTQEHKPFKTPEDLLAILHAAKAPIKIVWETK